MGVAPEYRSIHVGRDHKHTKWSKNIEPALSVRSGDTVTFDALDSSNGQIGAASDATSIGKMDLALANPVFGPIFVQDAEPGDVLRVEVLDLKVAGWGWTAVIPNFGLLADEFPEAALKIWRLDAAGATTSLKHNVRIPLRPFLGCMGVAPASDEPLSTIPPTNAGGNLDCRELSIGTVVFLPVQTRGALFSCGDGHAAQGHGEVCGTAIETPLTATLRFEVCKNQPWVTSPHYLVPAPAQHDNHAIFAAGCYATIGVDADLLEAAKKAVRSAIRWLVATKGLTRVEAYILASVAGDLHIVEAVNVPNYEVSMSIPLAVFT